MRVESNFKTKGKQIRKYADKLGKKHLKGAMSASLQEVANVSVSSFMKIDPTGGGGTMAQVVERARAQPTGARLRIRSGRLASSILGTWRFNMSGLPSIVKGEMRARPPVKGTGGQQESIREVSVSPGRIQGIVGSEVEYARIHEYGSTRMPKRAYLEPAVEKSLPGVIKIFDKSIDSTWERARI